METKKVVKVDVKESEKVKKILGSKNLNLIDKGFKIRKVDNFLLFPLVDDAGEDLKIKIKTKIKIKIKTKIKIEHAKMEKRRGIKDYKEHFPEELRKKLPRAFDVVGDICIMKLPEELIGMKKEIGEAVIGSYKNIEVVCIDKGVGGEYRKRRIEIIGGERRTLTTHKEFGFSYKVDVSKTYFSPRLAGERQRVAKQVKSCERVLDMFCGVGPFSIPIAKRAKEVFAVDINPDAIELLKENTKLNRVDNVFPILGDSKEVLRGERFDRVIMNLPHSSLQFLTSAFERTKENSVINLYRFSESPDTTPIKKIASASNKKIEKIESFKLHSYSNFESLHCFDITTE
jgi:tRNA (guanine37-N1)-methyltransferase